MNTREPSPCVPNGSYANNEYATYTFMANIFKDSHRFYGYAEPITIYQSNFVIPPFWHNSHVISYLHTHPGKNGKPGNVNHSAMDELFAEVAGRPYYVVTSDDYNIYSPKYGGDFELIQRNIGPRIGVDALDWIKYYWNQIWK